MQTEINRRVTPTNMGIMFDSTELINIRAFDSVDTGDSETLRNYTIVIRHNETEDAGKLFDKVLKKVMVYNPFGLNKELIDRVEAVMLETKLSVEDITDHIRAELNRRRFEPYFKAYKTGEMSIMQISQSLGISSKTFYKYLRREGAQKSFYNTKED